MKTAILLDSLELLKPAKDTSIALIKRAQDLGWSCFYFTQKDLFCQEGRAYAQVYELTIADEKTADWAITYDAGVQPLSVFDIILMRKDPPFDLEYIYTTYALELAEQEGVLIANKPQSLRQANEKFFTLHFPQCTPPTLVSKDMVRLKEFWRSYQNVIYKPLEGMGGNSVFQVDATGKNLSVILEVLTKNQTVTIMAQQYIPEISVTGDKRVLLINGEPIPYALARIPAPGELRGNLAAGARGEVVPITARDKWICKQIAPILREKGLYFVGIDIIGDFLTEINVTSPTCLREITAGSNIDIAGSYLQCLKKIKES